MERILVTGGRGFIGSHLVHRLLTSGKQVFVLDKSIYKKTFHDIGAATLIEGDVLSRELLHECLVQVDTCFHLAAISSIVACSKDWVFSHENNVLAFNGLLSELKQIPHRVKLVYASSAAVYGKPKVSPLSESAHVIPNTTYGADKLSNEIYAEVVRELFGFPSIGLRLFNVYGPGQLRSNPYSGVISAFKFALKNQQPLTIHGDGKQTRDFIYISDIVDAFLCAAQTPEDCSGVYNVCSGSEISINDLATMMIGLSKKNVSITHDLPRKNDVRSSLGDPTRATQKLGFFAKTSMSSGLKEFLEDTTFDG